MDLLMANELAGHLEKCIGYIISAGSGKLNSYSFCATSGSNLYKLIYLTPHNKNTIDVHHNLQHQYSNENTLAED